MFFHVQLLSPQHKMRLHHPWVAATLGIKKLRKIDIFNCNVAKICDNILQFVKCVSTDVNKKFSLRLSSTLVNGVCLIWREQVIFLEGKNAAMIISRERKIQQLAELLKELPTKPKAKRRKERKPAIIETPESYVEGLQINGHVSLELPPMPEELEAVSAVLARPDDITIREEVPRVEGPQWPDNFGELDVIPPLLPGLEAIPAEEAAPLQKEKEIPIEEPIQEMPQPDIPRVVIPEIQPAPVLDVIQVMPEASEIQVISKPEAPPAEKPTKKGRKALSSLQVAQLEYTLPKALVPKGKDQLSKRRINRRIKKYVVIDQPMKIFVLEPDYEFLNYKFPDFEPIEKFGVDYFELPEIDRERAPRDTISTRPSGRMESHSSLETPIEGVSLISAPATTPIIATLNKRPVEETFMEEAAPGAIAMEAPTKKKRTVTIEKVQALEYPEEEIVVPCIAPEPQPERQVSPSLIVAPEDVQELQYHEPEKRKSVSPRGEFGRKWSREIMRVVSEQEKLETVDICQALQKRLTKLNMAIIFSTLLCLAKDEYVTLQTEKDSLELKYIIKGTKEYPL